MIAILINAVVIFSLYFPGLREHKTLIQIDHFFVIFFLIEVIIKLFVYKPKSYFSTRWNWFDFIIVVVSLPSLFMAYLPLPDTSSLLLLRVLRLARLFRFMAFVPHLSMILSGLGRALRASVFVLMVLLFLDLILAVLTCHFYQNIAPEYFGNPLISAYTVFQLFTVEGWNEVADVIADNSSGEYMIGFSRFFFVLIVLIGGIFGMSLANAVFVDEMTMDNNNELEAKIDKLQGEITQIRELLERRDV